MQKIFLAALAAVTMTTLTTAGRAALPNGNATAETPGQPQNQGKAQNAAVPPLKSTEFPDGTGTISLPEGWTIDGAYRGAVGSKGPNGTAVVMGMPWMVLNPDHPVTNMPERAAMGPVAVARFGDLKAALIAVLKSNKGRVTSLRSQSAPSGIPGVPAAYFLYEFERDGKTIVGMGYFSAIGSPNDGMPYWQLYSSAVLAPKEVFIKELPTMMAIFNTWRPNGQKPREGSNSAMMDAAKEVNQKAAAASLKSQQEAWDRMNAKFLNEVIKSERP